MTSHTPTPQDVINVTGAWSSGHYQRTTGYTYVFYWSGSSNNDSVPRSILYNNTTRKWEDNGSGVPTSFDGNSATTTGANPQNVTGYSSNTAVWSFTNPYYDSNFGGTSTESLNTGTATQNMYGGLSFVVNASSDSTETYSISLDNVDNASIVPSGVGPWYKNYTYAEHTAVGYGTWRLYDQNGVLDDIVTQQSATPPPTAPPPTAPPASSTKKVFCNFW